MIERSPGQTEVIRGYECDAIHNVIEAYNDTYFVNSDPPDGWPDYISVFATSRDDYNVLIEFAADNDLSFPWLFGEVHFCTTIHEDGWLPADADSLGPTNIFVTITIVGPIACDSGDLLMIQSGYYFWDGQWRSYYGVDWTENFGGGIPNVSGTYNMECMEIVPGDPADFANVTELVPSTQSNVNPTVSGLTGLETWLWYDFSAPTSSELVAQVTVPARGTTWVLDMNAWVDEVWWDMDCETACDYRGPRAGVSEAGIDHVLDLPDTREQPAPLYDGGIEQEGLSAAEHLYRTKGDYIVSTSTVWRGIYTFLGVTYYYDPVVVSSALPYQVVEVRSIITEP